MQGGQAQAGEILLTAFQNEWQVFGVDGIPFLATSYADSKKLYAAQKPILEKKLAEQGMVLLYAVAWPPQGLYSKKPVASAADLKGSKWRAYSPATSRIAELVGAQPVTVQAAELSQALATGVVENNMTSGATGVDSKLYEHLKFYYDVQAWLPKNAVIVNKRAFDALDKPTQDALLKAAAALEVAPDDAVYIGDMFFDVNAARAAGMPCIAVSTGYCTHAELEALGPEVVLGDLHEVRDYLAGALTRR